MTTDEIYAEASRKTGKSDGELRAMARSVFASILLHTMENPERVVWTAATSSPFTVEVGAAPPERRRSRAGVRQPDIDEVVDETIEFGTEYKRAEPFMTVAFTEEPGGEITVGTSFHEHVPVARLYGLVGRAVAGLVEVARRVGQAKGMTADEVDAAIFKEFEEDA